MARQSAGPLSWRLVMHSTATSGSHPQFAGATWKKSTASISAACVEVAHVDGQWGVRDSKSQAGPFLVFNADEWDAFTTGVVNGEFTRDALA
jgi:hypothetical protein